MFIMKTKQKNLLVLGSNYSTKRVVEYAHELGLYVVVASRTGAGDAAEIADILRGNICGMRPTSCADQFSKAIDEAI